jgi:hypothetical protein
MKRVVFVFFLLCVDLFGCGSYSDLDSLSWLLGQWTGTDEQGVEFNETWTKSGATSFTGTGVALDINGDTLFNETLKIDLIDGVPYYVATVPKNPGPVLFKLIESEKHKLVFENPEHDFPQRIRYVLNDNNVLEVRLDGREKGKPKVERFTFRHVQDTKLQVK